MTFAEKNIRSQLITRLVHGQRLKQPTIKLNKSNRIVSGMHMNKRCTLVIHIEVVTDHAPLLTIYSSSFKPKQLYVSNQKNKLLSFQNHVKRWIRSTHTLWQWLTSASETWVYARQSWKFVHWGKKRYPHQSPSREQNSKGSYNKQPPEKDIGRWGAPSSYTDAALRW